MHVHISIDEATLNEVNQLAAWVLALEARGIRVLALRLPARCRHYWPDIPTGMQAKFMDRPVSFLDRDR